MSKLIVIAIALVLLASDAGMSQSARRRTRKRHTTSVETGWPPGKDTPLYKYTRELPAVDTVEVSEVRSSFSPTTKAFETQTVKSVTINGKEAERFASVWRALNSGEGAGCFAPTYTVRFFPNQQLLVGSTVCFHCHNLRLPGGSINGIYSFDGEGPTGRNC